MNLAQLQDNAEAAARHIATDRLPPDAGAIQKIRDTVADAFSAGAVEVIKDVLNAYQLFLDSDDLDGFRDDLTEVMSVYGYEDGEPELHYSGRPVDTIHLPEPEEEDR